jgi:DNA ligase (NAD+)
MTATTLIDRSYLTTLNTEELADEIRYHSDKYFNDEAEITDAEYDLLVNEMKARDSEHPVLAEVGADPSYGKKIAHDEVMGSLDKVTYDSEDEDTIRELEKWIETYGPVVTVTPKIDGLAVRLVYSEGKLIQAATRGNGAIGQDVTDNVREIVSIPNEIEFDDYVEIRGEIYMKKSDFRDFRQAMIDAGEKKIPANPRNAASGILNQKDPKKSARVPLYFFAYDVRGIDGWAETEIDASVAFNDLIEEIEYVPTDLVKAPRGRMIAVKKWEDARDTIDYQIDGIVFSANEFEVQKRHGYKGRCPVAKIAFKFRPEQTTTELIDIVWQLGRTGKLTPVAQLEPVELAGTVIDSPTLHNYAQIKAKDICIGDTVLIEKAGEIIPQVVRVVHKRLTGDDRDDNSVINYPEICPVCHEATELDKKKVSVWCKNPTCPGQAEFRMIHFLKTIEVDGVGPGIVGKLLEHGVVETIPDLFEMELSDITTLPGMGMSSATKVVDAIQDKKTIDLSTFLDSLGVDGLGTTTSKLLANEFLTLQEVLDVDWCEFEKLDGIGEKTAKSIRKGLNELEPMIDELLKVGVIIEDVEVVTTGSLIGKSFCVTGTLSVGRKEMAAEIEAAGGTVKSSVSKGLDYLVAGDKTGKGKTDKAAKYGVAVIDESTLRSMM